MYKHLNNKQKIYSTSKRLEIFEINEFAVHCNLGKYPPKLLGFDYLKQANIVFAI